MADQLEECGEHFYIIHNGRYVFPLRGLCRDRAQAVRETASMLKNRCKGVKLYSVQMRRNKLTGLVYEDEPVRLVVSIKD